jgi:putative membrane protein
LILEDDSLSNVTVTNGTVYNDGSRNIVSGCAVPGLAESFGLDDDSNIPG